MNKRMIIFGIVVISSLIHLESVYGCGKGSGWDLCCIPDLTECETWYSGWGDFKVGNTCVCAVRSSSDKCGSSGYCVVKGYLNYE